MKDKPFWKSKTIRAGVIIAGIGVVEWYGLELPYEIKYSLAAAFGLYGLRDAIGNIKAGKRK